MLFKILVLFTTLALCHARYVVQPKFYAQDSAIIVDGEKKVTPPHIQDLRSKYRQIQPYPIYHILPPFKGQTNVVTSSTPVPSTTTLSMPLSENPGYQNELIQIAKERLGLKSIDEIPSLTELGELLGTDNDQETMKYIRQLTNTDQGIALIKAYAETSDYTDNSSNSNQLEQTTEVQTQRPNLRYLTTKKATTGFFDRIAQYMNIYQPRRIEKFTNIDLLKHKTVVGKHKHLTQQQRRHQANNSAMNTDRKPIWMRKPLPYHYPVPMRPLATHFNTPTWSVVIAQLAKIVKIEPKEFEFFIHSNPQLAELVTKVGQFLLTNENSAIFDAQLVAAIQQAIAQDSHLKTLMRSSSDTLLK